MALPRLQSRSIFIIALLSVFGSALAFVVLVMRPAREELPVFATLLATPVALATAGAWVTSLSMWWRRFSSVAFALLSAYAIGALLIWLTLRITAQLMFLSDHDARLAEMIVLYATAVSLVFGYFVTSSLRRGIHNITFAAQQVQDGNLMARANEIGGDELAQLARQFNQMTTRLRDVRDQERRLEQARRDWIAWVSHDLRTPLTSIRARAEALSDGVVTDQAEVLDYLHAIKRDVEGLSLLTNDLFELATIEAGGLKLDVMPCVLADIVSDTITSLHVVASDKGISLTGQVDATVDTVWLSPQHIQRVLNNLVSNALKHTFVGTVHVHAERAAKFIRVSVSDSGEGIAADDLAHVFDRFYRAEHARTRATSGAQTGMGLGLAIAKAFVQAHGGQIGITSTLDVGTKVWFTIPDPMDFRASA